MNNVLVSVRNWWLRVYVNMLVNASIGMRNISMFLDDYAFNISVQDEVAHHYAMVEARVEVNNER